VSGLPDGLFSNQKTQFGLILEGLRLEKVYIFFMAIWNILWIFGIFYNHLVHFVFICYILSGFGIMYQEKSGNPGQCYQYVHEIHLISWSGIF
jgi:hypothetical protein